MNEPENDDLTFAEQARIARLEEFERRQVDRERWLAEVESGRWPTAAEPEAWQVARMERDWFRRLTGG